MFENDFFWRRFRIDNISNHDHSLLNESKGRYEPKAASFSYDPKNDDGMSVYSEALLTSYGLEEVDIIKPIDGDYISPKIFGIFKFRADKAKEIEPLLSYTHDIDHNDWSIKRGKSHLLMNVNTEGHKVQRVLWSSFRNKLLADHIIILGINQPNKYQRSV